MTFLASQADTDFHWNCSQSLTGFLQGKPISSLFILAIKDRDTLEGINSDVIIYFLVFGSIFLVAKFKPRALCMLREILCHLNTSQLWEFSLPTGSFHCQQTIMQVISSVKEDLQTVGSALVFARWVNTLPSSGNVSQCREQCHRPSLRPFKKPGKITSSLLYQSRDNELSISRSTVLYRVVLLE